MPLPDRPVKRCKCDHKESEHDAAPHYSVGFRGNLQPCHVLMCKCLVWKDRDDDV